MGLVVVVGVAVGATVVAGASGTRCGKQYLPPHPEAIAHEQPVEQENASVLLTPEVKQSTETLQLPHANCTAWLGNPAADTLPETLLHRW